MPLMTTATVTKLKRKAADFEQKKQLDKALALYIQLVDEAGRDLDDADLQIYNRVGDLLMRQSNVTEALAYYEKAVDIYAERGFLNNAIALCNKILRQSPARTTVYYKLGKISASKGFKSDARKNFLEYADRMQKGGNIDEAFRALKEFADLCPDQDDIRLLLADLLTKEQRPGEAVEQLEHLYSKLEAEGRSAEARATMDRIKAIDPDITPRASGAFIAQKTNDLVFLDLNEPVETVARATPLAITPVADPPEIVEVSGVGALEGLAITFFPEGSAAEGAAAAAPVEGLEVAASVSAGADIEALEDLDLVGTEVAPSSDPIDGIELNLAATGDLDIDVVTPVEGLASIATTITDTHPSLAPLLEAPPMSGAEFGDLDLEILDRAEAPRVHDLALPSSLPRLEERSEHGAVSPGIDASRASNDESDAIEEREPSARAEEGDQPPSISDSELAAVQSAHLSESLDNVVEPRPVPPESELVGGNGHGHAHAGSALDTSSLSDGLPRRNTAAPASTYGETKLKEQNGPPVRSAFEEDRVELPLLDLEAQANADSDDVVFDAGEAASIDDLLSAPPSFGDTEEAGSFEPGPLDLAAESSTDEWETEPQPEVLIDGEWRDEHVGDLVSGEMFVIGERREATRGPNDAGVFDDLAAAMMYDGGAQDERDRASGSLADGHGNGRRSTLSFGGTEAQLRRRLETDPANAALRRQLGEALLDEGQRDEGLNELEIAIHAYETQAAYSSAREIVDVILRVAPLSVHHHQKRVEYAVRSNDRSQLIRAYTELADALFRCGESGKSRVVYSRVLDLDANNDRARFALGMLSDDAGPTRRSDEVPTIDTGLPSAGASMMSGTLTPRTIEQLVIDHDPARPKGSFGTQAEAAMDAAIASNERITATKKPPSPESPRTASLDPALDEEVDAAFEEAHTPPPARVTTTPIVQTVQAWAPGSVATAGDDRSVPQSDIRTESSDYVDLGEWLRDSEPSRSTRMVSDDVAPTGDENADFAEMLRRFKQGVAANVDDEDYASHYDLGVAFKEMGLIDEAIAEFQKALRGDDHRVRAYEALGQCFVEQGQYQVATTLLRRALESTRADDQRLVGVLYLLGFASESMGRHGDAVGYYQRVFAVDIEFRDVSSRLAALDRKTP